MPRYFLDSSALVKRYHQESGTNLVEDLFRDSENRLFISRLAIVEIHSCFARLVREQVLAETEFPQLIARLEADVAAGLVTVAALSTQRLQGASTLLGTLCARRI
jgi:predicted nucleic acid-binding protein